MLDNEPEILSRIAEGDEKAFLLLHKHYYSFLKPVVDKYTGSGAASEDILQLTFLKVWLNRDQLPGIENMRGWIYKIAYREYLVSLRKQFNYDKRLNSYAALNMNSEVLRPDDYSHLDDIRKNIQMVVDRLAPKRRQIYELSRNEGLKINEIAEKLFISPQTVKNVLFIVLKTIREHLIAAGYLPQLLLFFSVFF
jgi:RNA polymerase sigma-19 factor, ECF subfamily